ncbi:hypothetical protein ACIBH1_31760 [Nonomuraea sp. NPDC050663]|uniref:hypothetical protein n=1 Tax=Nonomuraea sp. NPDC050663 TaxID=3364370 RepID=UPI0037AA839F
MTDQPYNVNQDLGDDEQISEEALYLDRLPQRHKIEEIDDEASRGIFHWVNEEDKRDSDTYNDPLEEPETLSEILDHDRAESDD